MATVTWAEENTAISSRLTAALASAQGVVPTCELIESGRNQKELGLDREIWYLRGYKKRVASTRLGMGEGFDVVRRVLFVDLLAPAEVGDEDISAIASAIELHFRTASDGLEFEEAPDLSDVFREPEGSHSLATLRCPYWFYRERTT